jgi:hypothetical protein
MSDTPSHGPRCIHLCCKSMLVYGEDFESDPEYTPGFTDFWCLQTSRNTGPDGELAALEVCCDPARMCHQEYWGQEKPTATAPPSAPPA